WDGAAGLRTADLRIANLTDRKLPLKLSAALPLEIEPVIVLEPKEARNVLVSVGGIEAFQGSLTISSEHHEEVMRVRARPTPAKIRVVKPEGRSFNFELMDTDTPPVHEIVVLNEGGSKAFIYAETGRPFYVVDGGDPTELAPGETMKISASMDPREVGTFERSLSVLGTANKIDFQLSALVTRNVDRSQVGVNLPELAPLITAQQAKLLNVLPDFKTRLLGKNDKRRVVKPEIPSVGKIYLEKQERRKLVLSWDHPGSPDLDYILEVEVYKREEDALPSVTWYQASEHVTVDKDEQGAKMTLKKLQPGRQFRIRILTINKDGHSSRPSRAELVYTLPPGRRAMWLLPFFLVIGGGGFYVWRRRQNF
ncbi:MAG: fibronectin type III domain-containing protein, partial [Verrucomicrobiales bacterium]